MWLCKRVAYRMCHDLFKLDSNSSLNFNFCSRNNMNIRRGSRRKWGKGRECLMEGDEKVSKKSSSSGDAILSKYIQAWTAHELDTNSILPDLRFQSKGSWSRGHTEIAGTWKPRYTYTHKCCLFNCCPSVRTLLFVFPPSTAERHLSHLYAPTVCAHCVRPLFASIKLICFEDLSFHPPSSTQTSTHRSIHG